MQNFEGQQICADKHISIRIFDILGRGKHQYNIMLNIPLQIPQSVERKYGCTKYYLELGICDKLGNNVLCIMPLVIKRIINICSKSEYKQPFRTTFQKTTYWGICNSQPLRVILNLPTCSFVAGDSIKYFVSIQNYSNFMNLQRLSVILTQTDTYRALKPKERVKKVHTTLNLMMHHFNRQNHNGKFEGSLKLPYSLISTSQESYLFGISYRLQFILIFKGFHTDGYISLPIIVENNRETLEKIADFTRLQMYPTPKCEKLVCTV
ncbi:uncharacterized protein LOC124419611 [Lucilia cuprina]|uniref:uncharacterized protein LOC124419611 n=1 Tax=Lucilia cuprina TaxID=7375 RepID=UPI001F05D9BF|nr:uncharacterized protein LOC124419611 [Lucilia cuprina]